jgi:hypothetical protein
MWLGRDRLAALHSGGSRDIATTVASVIPRDPSTAPTGLTTLLDGINAACSARIRRRPHHGGLRLFDALPFPRRQPFRSSSGTSIGHLEVFWADSEYHISRCGSRPILAGPLDRDTVLMCLLERVLDVHGLSGLTRSTIWR